MPRLLRLFAIFLLMLAVGAGAVYAWKNPESSTLDAATRARATGSFVGLLHGTTHYEVAGPDTGRVVLLVHGFSVPYYIWDSTFTALKSAGFRVIRYDLYGRGLSDRPDMAYDGALYDAQIDGLLDALHVSRPVDLVGLSFGGYVTAHYLAGHATRVRTLTLVDPVSARSSVAAALSVPVVGAWLWQVTAVPGMADNQSSDFLHPEHFPSWADQYRPQMRFKGFGRALLRSRALLSHVDFDTLYARVAKSGVPVLVVWGKQDQTVPVALSDVVRRNVPGAEFFLVDSAGHLPHIEQATLVNARLLEFFAAHASP